MNYIDTIVSVLRQAGVAPWSGAGSAVRRGWDHWKPGEPLTTGEGAARTPHAFDAQLPPEARWIVHPGMTDLQLIAGLWRQCMIRPGDPRGGTREDIFAISSLAAQCSRDERVVALLGHTPRDLAMWLVDLSRRDPEVFEHVLAKRFRAALACRRDLIDDPWPSAVVASWTGNQADYLPPFIVAVLYAELARLAQNQAGLLQLAFDAGVELTTTRFLERVSLAGGRHEPEAVKRALAMLPFQSVALTPPDQMLHAIDGEAASTWARTAAATIALAINQAGFATVVPASPEGAKAWRDNHAASPAFWLEAREGYGYSRQPRPAATLWGLNWKHHAATGLLEIAAQAQAWNQRYRPAGKRLSALPRRARIKAVAAIGFGWLAEADPKAALAELSKMSAAAAQGLTAQVITPLHVDAVLTDHSGEELFSRTIERMSKRPGPGELGYTASYKPHLWLDDVGDDIAHYHEFHAHALREHADAVAGNLPAVLQDTSRMDPVYARLLGRQHGVQPPHGAIGHNRPPKAMTADPAAAAAAQKLGQMVSPLSTSSILEVLRGRK